MSDSIIDSLKYFDNSQNDKINKTLKSFLSNSQQTINCVLSDASTDNFAVSTEAIKKELEKYSSVSITDEYLDSSINTKLCSELLEVLNSTKADQISGLDVFLAGIKFKSTKLDKIEVSDTEVVRTNYDIIDVSMEEPVVRISNGDTTIENILEAIHTREELDDIDTYLNKAGSVKTVNRKSKVIYSVPLWAYRRSRATLDLKMKQLNRLSKRKTVSNSGNTDSGSTSSWTPSTYVQHLRDILDFKSTEESSLKLNLFEYGFNKEGITMDELRELRTSISLAKENLSKDGYVALSEGRLVKSIDEKGYVAYASSNKIAAFSPLILPHLDLNPLRYATSELQLKSSKTGGFTSFDRSSARKDLRHAVFNSSVQALLKKAPDFRQNQFTGIFVFYPDITSADDPLTDFESITNNLNGVDTTDTTLNLEKSGGDGEIASLNEAYNRVLHTYFVRMQDITIPGASMSSYELPFLTKKIKKINSSFTEKHVITINFILDENGLILRAFNLLSGTFGYSSLASSDENAIYAKTLAPTMYSYENKSQINLVVNYNDFRNTSSRITDDVPITRSSYLPTMQDVSSSSESIVNNHYSSDKQDYVIGEPTSYRQFILEDIRFLGISSGVQFQRDSSNKLTVPVDIMFKRITTVDNNKIN